MVSKELFQSLKNGAVLVIGDVMLDRYIEGDVTRISLEAPIPILDKQSERYILGGAGNVAANLRSFNVAVGLIGIVGDDDSSTKITSMLEKINVNSNLVSVRNSHSTTKTRFTNKQHQVFRFDVDLKLSRDKEIIDYVKANIDDYNVVLLSDYGKGVISNVTAREIIKLANKKGKKVLVDPKGSDYKKYDGAYLITPNRNELCEAVGLDVQGNENQYAQKLLDSINIDNMLVTLGQDGMVIVGKELAKYYRSQAVEIFDVSGAGDTVISSIAAGISAGLSLDNSIEIANIAAGCVVGKFGTATTTIDELIHRSNNKIVMLDDAVDIVKTWKAENKTVGFTNGCFDLLHVGHVEVLRKSKEKCDKLVLGLNSDSSIKKIKGEDRPIIDQNSRSILLSEFQSVDLIVIFDEETPLNLIKHIKPDVLIKGSNYKINEIVGSDFVISYGGDVVTVELVKGLSTTSIIDNIKEKSD